MKWYGVALSLLIGLRVYVHPANATPSDFEGWFTATALASLDASTRYQFSLELQPRIGDDWQRAAILLIRPALIYNPSHALSLSTGYAWHPMFYDADYYRTYRDEQRIWQQILYRCDLWGISWLHRLRQEQRKIEHTDGISNRTRYLLRESLPFNDDGTSGITSFQEIMVTLNTVTDGPWSGYDRSRIFLGPYWKRGIMRYEVGYLGEHAKRFGQDERWVNAIAASVTVTIE
jgi:hypothetical protein